MMRAAVGDLNHLIRGGAAWTTAILPPICAVIAFDPALSNGFVDWDDYENFTQNIAYRGLGWAQIRWAFTTLHLGVYQPLSWIILSAQHAIWGLDPWGYHLTSLALYTAVIIMLEVLSVAVLRRCLPELAREWPAAIGMGSAFASALFAVHPLRTEVVAWVSCQPYLPCALFSIVSVLAYLKAFPTGEEIHAGWLITSFLAFAAALLSKSVAVSLPAILLILDIYPLRRLGPSLRARNSVRIIGEKVPFFALAFVFMGIALHARQVAMPTAPAEQINLPTRVAQACAGVWFYLGKTFWPLGLTADYPMPERMELARPPYVLAALAVIGVSMGLFLLRRKWPGMLAAWASYLVILAPNSGLVWSSPRFAADRYSFVSMMGGTILLAAGLSKIAQVIVRSRGATALAAVSLVAVLTGLTVLSWRQCTTWSSSTTLWSHALAHAHAKTAELYYKLGNALLWEVGPGPSLGPLNTALRLDREHPEAHRSLGMALLKLRRIDEAQTHFAEALRLMPDLPSANFGMGSVLLRSGRPDQAVPFLAKAVRLDPHNADSRDNLGVALIQLGRPREAEIHLQEAVRLNPRDVELRNNLGVSLLEQEKLVEAEAQFAEALRLKPDHKIAGFLLSSVRKRRVPPVLHH